MTLKAYYLSSNFKVSTSGEFTLFDQSLFKHFSYSENVCVVKQYKLLNFTVYWNWNVAEAYIKRRNFSFIEDKLWRDEGREKEKTQEINFEDNKQMSFRNETKYWKT